MNPAFKSIWPASTVYVQEGLPAVGKHLKVTAHAKP